MSADRDPVEDDLDNVSRGSAHARPGHVAVGDFPLWILVAGKQTPLHLIELPLVCYIPLLQQNDLAV